MNKKGFTLLEVLITIIIIGIIATMSIINIRKAILHDVLRTEADKLYSELRGTKAIGLKFDDGIVIRFYTENSCSIYVDTSGTDSDEDNLLFYKVYDISEPISIGIPDEGPVTGPDGFEWDANGISSAWKPTLRMSRNSPNLFTIGSVYLKHSNLKKVTYCIGIIDDFINFKIYKWDGSEWIEV